MEVCEERSQLYFPSGWTGHGELLAWKQREEKTTGNSSAMKPVENFFLLLNLQST
jgi:hypothetical protein